MRNKTNLHQIVAFILELFEYKDRRGGPVARINHPIIIVYVH